MKDEIQLGQVGELDLDISEGVASVKLSISVPQAALKSSLCIEMSAVDLIDKLFDLIESKSSPGGVAIEEGIKSVVKAAVMAL